MVTCFPRLKMSLEVLRSVSRLLGKLFGIRYFCLYFSFSVKFSNSFQMLTVLIVGQKSHSIDARITNRCNVSSVLDLQILNMNFTNLTKFSRKYSRSPVRVRVNLFCLMSFLCQNICFSNDASDAFCASVTHCHFHHWKHFCWFGASACSSSSAGCCHRPATASRRIFSSDCVRQHSRTIPR